MAPPSLPPELRGLVFTRADAHRHGISDGTLRGPRITAVLTGIYRYVDTELTPDLAIQAARQALPPDAVLCRTSALAWRGLSWRPLLPLHFATNLALRSRHAAIRLHRHDGTLTPQDMRGVPITGPDRTFVDCGTQLSLPELVATGDWLIAKGFTDDLTLRGYALQSHLDGVQRARVAAELVRPGAESPRESMTRFNLVAWGLPEPHVNLVITDAEGRFLGRSDLVYEAWRVLVEYDGWYHERDAAQRQRDILRREGLEAAGWRVVVLTSADSARAAAWRVYGALRDRGFDGPSPRFQSARFGRWMQPNPRQNYKA
jgi:hypothetical protein